MTKKSMTVPETMRPELAGLKARKSTGKVANKATINPRLRGEDLERAWAKWLGRIKWELFVTLTFDPKRVFPVNRNLASHEASRWLQFASYACRRPLAWVYSTERTKNGHWHVHVLMQGTKNSRWKTLMTIWRMRNGRAMAKQVYMVPGITLYTSKYAAKEGEVILSDTINLQRFPPLALDQIVVPLQPETAES